MSPLPYPCTPRLAPRRLTLGRLVFLGMLVLAPSPAVAGGFYLQEQSGAAAGRAFAGTAAQWDTAQAQFDNAALLSDAGTLTVSGSVQALLISSGQENRGTSIAGLRPGLVGGGDGGNPFKPVVLVPSAAIAVPLSDRTTAGLSFNAPFGLSVRYDDGWFGRYDSVRSTLRTYNLSASVAHRITPVVSLGGGIDLQRITARLSAALPDPFGAGDGLQDLSGSDWSWGWHAGATWDVGPLRLAASYRSHISHRLDGDLAISGLSGPLAAANGVRAATAPVKLPDIATAALRWRLNGRTDLLGHVRWFNWSTFDAIRVTPENGPTTVSLQNYRDTWSFAAGGEHQLNARWRLRAGLQFDQTPTRDAFRTTRVPDGNRFWLATGAQWQFSDQLQLALSYAHVFVSAEDIDRTDIAFEGTPLATAVTTRSRNTGNVDIVGASASWRW